MNALKVRHQERGGLYITQVLQKLILIPYLVLAMLAGLIIFWALNRVDPLEIVAQLGTPSGRPGDVIRFEAVVKRDFTPRCSIVVQRYVVGSDGYRYFFQPFSVSPAALDYLTHGSATELKTTLEIPRAMPPGKAKLVTGLSYRCNPLDRLWPIEVTTELEFYVLSP